MARWTGLLPQNVRRGLQNLKKMGLISVLISPTSSTSTVYEVPIVRGYLDWRRMRDDAAKETQFKGTHSEVYSKQVDPDNQSNYSSILNSSTKKENLKKTRNLSRSEEILPHKIKAYIASVKPHRKRVEEEYHLQQLLLDYPVDDIVESLDYLRSNGAIDTKERVHSPMKYLCFTAEEIIAAVTKEKARITRSESLRARLEQDQTNEEDKRNTQASEIAEALVAFSNLTADEQRHHISKFKQDNFGNNRLEIPESVALKLAAQNWFTNQNNDKY